MNCQKEGERGRESCGHREKGKNIVKSTKCTKEPSYLSTKKYPFFLVFGKNNFPGSVEVNITHVYIKE